MRETIKSHVHTRIEHVTHTSTIKQTYMLMYMMYIHVYTTNTIQK